ncbi:hypothetical protein H2248_005527 [Termitomyces sp. 'cryptogamus']|nr:hypothetical protein H2248_005527 [Termitomyces sp. 'cryptogamus']
MKQTVKRWSNVHLASLIYIAKGVGCISMTVDAKGKDTALPLPVKSLKKVHVAEQLLNWHLKQSQIIQDTAGSGCDDNNLPPLQHGSVFTTKEMEVFGKDIQNLVKPS